MLCTRQLMHEVPSIKIWPNWKPRNLYILYSFCGYKLNLFNCKRFSSHVVGNCSTVFYECSCWHTCCVLWEWAHAIIHQPKKNQKKNRFLVTWICAHAIVPRPLFLGCWTSMGSMPMFIKWVDFESTTLACKYLQSGWPTMIYWHSILFWICIYHGKS
jgi:hypothetical protein